MFFVGIDRVSDYAVLIYCTLFIGVLFYSAIKSYELERQWIHQAVPVIVRYLPQKFGQGMDILLLEGQMGITNRKKKHYIVRFPPF